MGSTAVWLAGGADALTWRAADGLHRPWTWFGAALVHLSTAHWLGNLLALAALAALGWAVRAGRAATAAWALAWPLSTVGLWTWPVVGHYVGLSGVVHAGVAVLALHCAGPAGRRTVGLLLAAGLALKLAGEQAWRQPVRFDPAWGFDVVVAAHLSGAVAGAACALLVCAARGLLFSRRP